MNKIKIGVIGSVINIINKRLNKKLEKIAQEIGKEIAKNKAILCFGYEENEDSLPMIAARSAERYGGETIAFIYGNHKKNLKKLKSLQIITGLEKGGGREFSFILSCDGVIAISGGSGTLTEIAIAYQAGIPIVTIKGSRGWSDQLADKFLDERKRFKIISVRKVVDAVKILMLKLKI